ncbi:MAG: hypothetical protein K940chlam7_02137 [Chlamydiae bacterium]|nr:hypothetical protein [Chlamydiota bacterium]
MQKGHKLQFDCLSCKEPVRFSIFELDNSEEPVICSKCSKQYILKDETLRRQLTKFEALCRQILESEEILGNTSVGIDIGEHHVKVPYKLLLTRLNSSLELTIGDQPVSIVFRLEPSLDIPESENK